MKMTVLAAVVLLLLAGCGSDPEPLSENSACARLVSGGTASPVRLAVSYYSGLGNSPGEPVPTAPEVKAVVKDLDDLAERVPDAMQEDVKTLSESLQDAKDGDLSGVEDVRAAALSLGKTCEAFLP